VLGSVAGASVLFNLAWMLRGVRDVMMADADADRDAPAPAMQVN